MLVFALAGIGAAPAPTALCVPLLMDCSAPAPSPSPGPVDPGLIGGVVDGLVGGVVGGEPGGATAPGIPLVNPEPDPGAPTMTLPAAQLGGSSISFTGLKALKLVTVPLADGTTAAVFKLEADRIVVDDFLLDVRHATGPSLVTNATQMVLEGNCEVYVDSVTAGLLGGGGITLLAPTPPPGDELPPQLLRVTLGFVGLTADRISFDDPHQHLYE